MIFFLGLVLLFGEAQAQAGCCYKINIDVSKSDSRLGNLNGVWTSTSSLNGRTVYTKGNSLFLFYADGPKRWIVEDKIGKTLAKNGLQHHGFIRHEGDAYCPTKAGNRWSQVHNPYVIDSTITIRCN